MKQEQANRKRKKRHFRVGLPLLLAALILVGVFACNPQLLSDIKTILPQGHTLPVKGSGGAIVIDAGHGGPDSPGCQYGNATESAITLEIAKQVDKLLTEQGYHTRMIRTEDVTVGTVERAQMAKPGDIYVSIHVNAQEGGTEVTGIETWYNKDITGSVALAKSVQAAMLKETGTKDRGVKESGELIVTRESKVPSCLAEVGFLSNPEEREKLSSADYQKRLAAAIAQGVIKFLEN